MLQDNRPEFFMWSGIDHYTIVFHSGGLGYVMYRDNEDGPYCGIEEVFDHQLDFDAVSRIADPDEQDEEIRIYFTDHVNPQLEDRFFLDGEEPEDRDLEFLCGSEEELIKATRLVVDSDPDMRKNSQKIVYLAGDDDTTPLICIESSDCELSERAEFLCARIAGLNHFAGHAYEYNDGARDRANGWCLVEYTVAVETEPVSAHRALAAKEELRSYLASKGLMNDPEVIAVLGESEISKDETRFAK